jgi:hypothetical protein
MSAATCNIERLTTSWLRPFHALQKQKERTAQAIQKAACVCTSIAFQLIPEDSFLWRAASIQMQSLYSDLRVTPGLQHSCHLFQASQLRQGQQPQSPLQAPKQDFV